jgi:hypothetical protein
MGAMKAFKMEMDSHIADAVDHGATTTSGVIAYVRTMLPAHQAVDEKYVRSQVERILGEY